MALVRASRGVPPDLGQRRRPLALQHICVAGRRLDESRFRPVRLDERRSRPRRGGGAGASGCAFAAGDLSSSRGTPLPSHRPTRVGVHAARADATAGTHRDRYVHPVRCSESATVPAPTICASALGRAGAGRVSGGRCRAQHQSYSIMTWRRWCRSRGGGQLRTGQTRPATPLLEQRTPAAGANSHPDHAARLAPGPSRPCGIGISAGWQASTAEPAAPGWSTLPPPRRGRGRRPGRTRLPTRGFPSSPRRHRRVGGSRGGPGPVRCGS